MPAGAGAVKSGLSAYIAVTAAYWAFMLTDGALRMLVLLHFHTQGFSPVQLANLFLLYELAGIVTNLCAGWIGARFGLTRTLYAGLVIQVLALFAFSFMNPGWTIAASVIFVMAVQGASGVAKDLAKMSAKSAVKILAPDGQQGALFKWVAILTGSKNAVKGFGFLMGAGLLALIGFTASIIAMAVALAVVLAAVAAFMPAGLPQGRKSVRFKEVFSKDPYVNWLSAARMFLFGARDVWFVVGIPIYFYAVLSDGSDAGNRNAFFLIGFFMAAWIVFYGAVQASAPSLLKATSDSLVQTVARAKFWVGLLTLIPVGLSVAAFVAGNAQPLWLTGLLIAGLLVFGAVFAINSSLHSYLILAFSDQDRVTMNVGFYYMSNAAGRLLGTLLSGISYQTGGLVLCLLTAGVMAALSWLCATRLSKR